MQAQGNSAITLDSSIEQAEKAHKFITELPTQFCDALNYLMGRFKVTNEMLAERMDTSARNISRYRNNELLPSREWVLALVFALHLHPLISMKMYAMAGYALTNCKRDEYWSIHLHLDYMRSVEEINIILQREGFEPLTLGRAKTA